MTRMKRIGHHGNDLDSVERYNSLSRRICAEAPDPQLAMQWLEQATTSVRHYNWPVLLIGYALLSFGFALFFGGGLIDGVSAAVCGLLVGYVHRTMDNLKVNQFFSTIASSFIMGLAAYAMSHLGIAQNADAVTIGTLMLIVPGMVFTNALRDIIFGDTNSGVNRIVQMLLIAAAIALGTGAAWNLANALWGVPISGIAIDYPWWIQCLASFLGCIGLSILFNIRFPGGFLCALGAALSWAAYCGVFHFSSNIITANFAAAVVAAVYSEIMARIRKYPAISYLVVSIFPMLPGAGIYYTTNHLVRGDMPQFASVGMQTLSIAGALAVGILLVSTLVRLWTVWKQRKHN